MSAPPQLKLWIISWNIEYAAPSKENVTIMAGDIKREMPDLVFVGVQESIKSDDELFLCGLIHKHISDLYDYESIGTIKGSTKPGNIRSIVKTKISKREKTKEFFNYQHMGVLIRKKQDSGSFHQIKDKHYSTRQLGYATRGKFLSEKGGIYADIKLSSSRIAVISSHIHGGIDDKKTSREHDLRKILAWPASHLTADITKESSHEEIAAALKKDYDMIFLFGDLNHRLVANPENYMRKIIRKLPQGFNKGNSLDTGRMAELILDDDSREQMILFDSIRHQPICYTYGFQFPEPRNRDGNIIFPTYKRIYKKIAEKNNPAYKFYSMRQDNAKLLDTNDQKNLLKAAYFPDDIVWSKKRKCYELGWLDRVGIMRGKNTSKIRIEAFHDYPQMCQSDHVPVVFKAKLLTKVDVTKNSLADNNLAGFTADDIEIYHKKGLIDIRHLGIQKYKK